MASHFVANLQESPNLSFRRADAKEMLGSYASVLALRVLQKAAGFAVMVAVFRFLSVQDVATYNFAVTAAAAMAVFALPQMTHAVAQSVARGFGGTYRRAARMSVAASFLGTMLASLVALYFLYWEREEQIALAVLVVAVFFPAVAGLAHWRGILFGKGGFAKLALVEGVHALLRTGGLLVVMLVGVTENTVSLLLVIGFSVSATVNGAMTLRYRAELRAGSEVEPGSLRYGLCTSVYAGLASLAQQVEKLILFALSPQAMAYYVAGERWSALWAGLVQDLGAVMAPRFARRRHFDAELDRVLRRLAFALGGACLAIAFLLFPIVIPFAFSETYTSSVGVAQLLTVAAVMLFHSSLRFRYVSSKLDLKNYRNVTLLVSLARIAVATPLVYCFGISGAIASVYIGNSIAAWSVHRAVLDHRRIDAASPSGAEPIAGNGIGPTAC